jgi:hypothetical protein
MAVVLVLACLGGAVAATYLAPLPSFRQTVGAAPPRTATLDLRVRGPKCRHSTEQFVQWLAMRDDEFALPFVKVEAWPEPGFAAVRITYDADRADERKVRGAITEPRFDRAGGWQVSPYRIQGYDPLEAD